MYFVIVCYNVILLFIGTGLAAGSSSPTIVRDELTDNKNDWWNYETRNYEHLPNFQRSESSPNELTTVSYSSNGKYLYATIFLDFNFTREPKNHTSAYGMLIDVDDNNNTGRQGWDYMMRIFWNGRNWTNILEEWSAQGIARTLESEPNYTSFFPMKENEKYVQLSLDLEKVTSPVKYKLLFFVDYDFLGNQLTDFSDWIHVPPSKYSMNAPAGCTVVEPGAEKIIPIQINSSYAIRDAKASLKVNERTDGLNAFFKPSERNLSNSVTISDLHLVPNKDLSNEKLYFLPLTAIISFPNSSVPSRSGPSLTTGTPNQTTSPIYLPITVDPVTIDERFGSFWTTYGGVISFIGAGFAAGFAALIIDRIKNRKQTSKSE